MQTNHALQPWVKFCLKHNLKAVLYLVWVLAIPLYFIVAALSSVVDAAEDARLDLADIKLLKKDSND